MAQSKTILEQAKVDIKAQGDDMVITIKGVKGATGVDSASGKSKVLATTHGNVYLSELDCHIGVNVYRK